MIKLKEKRINLIKNNKKYRKAFIKRHLKNMLLFIIFAILLTIFSIYIKSGDYTKHVSTVVNIGERLKYIWLDILTILGLFYILKSIFGSSKLSIIILLVASSIFEIANMITYDQRNIMLAFSDLYSLKTALNVTPTSSFKINYIGIVINIIFIVLIIKFFKFKRYKLKGIKELLRRFIYFIIGFLIIIMLKNSYIINKEPFWNINEEYLNRGTAYTLLRQLNNINLKKYKDYNEDEEKTILKELEEKIEEESKEKNYSKERPNIIVVMNESFSDLYKEYEMGNRDSIPYFRSIAEGENVISGTMYSGEFGGGTANVEYEFLTQNITSILPENSVAYNQFIKNNRETIVTNLEELGYDTIAFHSWYSSGYSRPNAYKALGFNHIYFYEDYDPKNDWEYTVHNFTKDVSTYEKVIKHIEEKNGPLFEYVVTMENHRGYYVHNDNKEDDYIDNNEANCFLEQLARSDEAIKYLIDYINKMDEKTIVVMFGDHQPYLEIMDDMEISIENKSKVPFFIYANYDIEEKYNQIISPIYFQNEIYDLLNFKKSAYMKFIEEIRNEIPMITKKIYMDNQEKIYNINDESSKYIDLIKKLEKMAYYQMTYK